MPYLTILNYFQDDMLAHKQLTIIVHELKGLIK